MKICIAIALFLSSFWLNAQKLHYSLYHFQASNINPAYIGDFSEDIQAVGLNSSMEQLGYGI
jgi:hypothetical protein